MNEYLEKSLLIKELRHLIDALKLKDSVCMKQPKPKHALKTFLCCAMNRFFKKQLLTFKALQNPIQTAVTFAEQSLYAQSFSWRIYTT